jgi:hypothetical protein
MKNPFANLFFVEKKGKFYAFEALAADGDGACPPSVL